MPEITERMPLSVSCTFWQGEHEHLLTQFSSCLPVVTAEQSWGFNALLWSLDREWMRFLYQMEKYREINGGDIPGNSVLAGIA